MHAWRGFLIVIIVASGVAAAHPAARGANVPCGASWTARADAILT